METSISILAALTALLVLALDCRVIWTKWLDRDWRGLVAALVVLPLAVWLAWWQIRKLL